MVAAAIVFGVPVSAPVVVLKLILGGVALIAKLVMTEPVELVVKPVAAVLTVRVSVDDVSVKAGRTTGAAAGAAAGSWIGFGLPQPAGRLDKASIKILNEEYSIAAELIIFALFVFAETVNL